MMLVWVGGEPAPAAGALWWAAGSGGARRAGAAGSAPRSAPVARPHAGAWVGARVLVVDDEPDIRRMLRSALEDEGYEVREAADGVEALAQARVWRPDVVVLDLLMPALNGWQFAEAYGSQTARVDGRRAAVIAITAAGPGAVRAAEAQGMVSAVLSKPLDVDELIETIERHAGHSGHAGGGRAV